jgi:hypothetical protein
MLSNGRGGAVSPSYPAQCLYHRRSPHHLRAPSVYTWPLGTEFSQLPSAVTSTVDHSLGSTSLCFLQVPSAVISTVDHSLGSSLCFLQVPSVVTSTVHHSLGSSLCFSQVPIAVTSTVDHPLGPPSLIRLRRFLPPCRALKAQEWNILSVKGRDWSGATQRAGRV